MRYSSIRKPFALNEEDDNVEKLAAVEHDGWARWQKYLFSKCKKGEDGSMIIPKEYVERWQRQVATKYEDLSDEEKESDRKEVRKFLAVKD